MVDTVAEEIWVAAMEEDMAVEEATWEADLEVMEEEWAAWAVWVAVVVLAPIREEVRIHNFSFKHCFSWWPYHAGWKHGRQRLR